VLLILTKNIRFKSKRKDQIQYYLTNKAVDDLTEIWDYTIETNEMQAEKYYDLLIASCDNLANNPELGRKL
jgi:toxin ParE1/3/4